MRISGSHRSLKLQSGFARGVGQGLDSSVIEEAAAIEDHCVHARGLRLRRDRLADFLGLGHAVARGLQLDGRRRAQGAAGRVVDQLRVKVVEAAKHCQPRALRGAGDVDTHALVPLRTVDLAVCSLDHAVVLAPLPALPGLRRIFSPRYITPLPLYGSGGRIARMLAATCPTSSIEMPLTENLVGSATSIVMPFGGLNLMGCE